ncbi:hypothetical protein M422DRAFT_252142 [Sphaerobolus stellatus SS14]|uniref:Uncharacterized protein n=1 Tax=Sphaerobolus stellatus (strain SS14) TaxID=990650 RepID=A0A0C9VQF1_SPHS4|nr:hypothetical protein M422DRAFT_252142 [Sphaerobolus stellatus SS14]
MSMCRNRKQAEELSAPAVGEDEPIPGLTAGELTDPSPSSVDPQQSSKVFAQEHLGGLSMRVHGPQTVPARVQSPIGAASAAGTSAPSQHQSRVVKASGTATKGQDSSQGIYSGLDSEHNLGGAPDESNHASPNEGGTENEDGSFTIKASELSTLQKEYVDLMNLKENGEIVLAEAMEATEQLNTVFNQIRTPMNRMSPMLKDIFLVPKQKSSGKTIESGNNWTCDKAAAKAATERISAVHETLRLVTLPKTIPLHTIVKNGTHRQPRSHPSPIHNLFRRFLIALQDVETLDPTRKPPTWQAEFTAHIADNREEAA